MISLRSIPSLTHVQPNINLIPSLVAPIIIRNDVLGEHEVVEFRPGGAERPKLTFVNVAATCAVAQFPSQMCASKLQASCKQVAPSL